MVHLNTVRSVSRRAASWRCLVVCGATTLATLGTETIASAQQPGPPANQQGPTPVDYGQALTWLATSSRKFDEGQSKDWALNWGGYFYIPANVGVDRALVTHKENANDFDHTPYTRKENVTTFHMPPVTPDNVYGTFSFTNAVLTPWAAVNMTYGNRDVTAQIGIGGWYPMTSQIPNVPGVPWGTLVVGGTVTMRAYDLLGTSGRAQLTVGQISAGYGADGSSGAYGTNPIGGVGILPGYLGAAEYDTAGLTFRFEQGFGIRKGEALVNHAHAYVGNSVWRAGMHYMTAWAADNIATQGDLRGRYTTVGPEFKIDTKFAGRLNIAGAYLKAYRAQNVGGGFGVVNANTGIDLTSNYLGGVGSGGMSIAMAQYELNLGQALSYPLPASDESPNVTFDLYGMFINVDSKEKAWDNKQKLKWGSELTYYVLPWFGVQGRYDRVIADMSDPSQTFSAISPRILFRSDWVTHEQIRLQYTRYSYGSSGPKSPGAYLPTLPDPVPGTPINERPFDRNVFQVSASMWF